MMILNLLRVGQGTLEEMVGLNKLMGQDSNSSSSADDGIHPLQSPRSVQRIHHYCAEVLDDYIHLVRLAELKQYPYSDSGMSGETSNLLLAF